jgi:hypothetical protein
MLGAAIFLGRGYALTVHAMENLPCLPEESEKPSCPTKNLKKTGDRFHLQHVFFTVHDFWKRKSHLEKGGFQVMGILNSWMVYFSENPSKKWMITRGTPMT